MTRIEEFARDIGPQDPVTCVGGRTHWDLAGRADPTAREVQPPDQIIEIVPEEMIVRVGAGTPLADLHHALAEVGQRVGLPGHPLGPPDEHPPPGTVEAQATVGGALAVGHGGIHQLSLGPPRDSVMEITYVTAAGEVSKSGGPVVKNVSGFDLCRLLVGSFGTLGFLAEVVLRATPLPAESQWFRRPLDGEAGTRLQDLIHSPGSILCTNDALYILLEGHGADVAAEARLLTERDFEPVQSPPQLLPSRCSSRRGDELKRGLTLGEPFVGLIGTGVVTIGASTPAGTAARRARSEVFVDPVAASLNRALKQKFDPTGRLNPGRDVLFGTTETPVEP